ncbi:MAG: hypothetical protein ACRC5C_08410, partial [Bacilli bacterium]
DAYWTPWVPHNYVSMQLTETSSLQTEVYGAATSWLADTLTAQLIEKRLNGEPTEFSSKEYEQVYFVSENDQIQLLLRKDDRITFMTVSGEGITVDDLLSKIENL